MMNREDVLNKFMKLFDSIEKAGVFYKAKYKGASISFCEPVFDAPMTAMYVEAITRAEVKHVIAILTSC